MYASVSCANDRPTGGVKVSAAWNSQSLNGAVRLELRRYLTSDFEQMLPYYTVVYSKPTGSASLTVADLTFDFVDVAPVAKVSYTYDYVVINSSNLEFEQESAAIVSEFEGIVVADANGSWHSAFGTSENRFAVNAQKNKPVNYIVTLSGKFPHRVSNTQANYWTGTCVAVWLPHITTEAGCVEPTIENANDYRLTFMEWLMSDTEKYMKTSDGKVMMISIDGNPQEVYNQVTGLTGVSFDWTQIGEVGRPAYNAIPGPAWKG